MTACFRPICFTDCATRSGSSGSLKVGLPVLTLQNPHRRVQVSPRIMNVAVPASQHSPMFGHAASSQTVCSPAPSIIDLSSRYFPPPGAGHLEPRRLALAEGPHLAHVEDARAAGIALGSGCSRG